MVTLGRCKRVVVLTGNGIVETVDRAARRGRNPANALVTPTLPDEIIALDGAHGEEVLAAVGIVKTQHQVTVGGTTIVAIPRIVGIVRIICTRIRRLGIARDLELGGRCAI